MGLFGSKNKVKVKGLPPVFTCELCGETKLYANPIYRLEDNMFLYAFCKKCYAKVTPLFPLGFPLSAEEFHQQLNAMNNSFEVPAEVSNIVAANNLENNIVSGDAIPGKEIVSSLGIVTGKDSYNPVRLIGEGLLNEDAYSKSAIERATKKMIEAAVEKGADAIVSFRTETTTSAYNNINVLVTGTAVKTKDATIKNNEPVNQSSAADEIRKYKALLDDDIITKEEFEKKKKELLG